MDVFKNPYFKSMNNFILCIKPRQLGNTMPFMDTFLHFRERTASSRRGAVSGADREKVGKKGVVRDPAVHLEVLEHFLIHAKENHFTVLGITYSPIRGPEGNIEYLGFLRKSEEPSAQIDLNAIVEASHSTLKE